MAGPPLTAATVATPARTLTAHGVLAATAGLLVVLLALRLRSGLAFGLALTFVIFVPAERLLALRPHQRVLRRQFWTDVVHFCVNTTLANAAALVGVVAIIVTIRALPVSGLQAGVAVQPLGVQFAEVFLITSVAGYWAHRATHAVPFLWRFHKVHHSIEEMDWLASARVHPLDQAFTRSAAFLPVYLLGFPRVSFGALVFLLTLQALFIHANVRVRGGPLKYVIATPLYHHWHHSNEPGTQDHNFAGEFPLLDWMFGTLLLPRDGRFPVAYGMDEPIARSWVGQIAAPFRTAPARAGA
jgi:sterol desaturase/sphingolipid hydroxylase (fatty acid hydroxylase superfamily)